MSARTTWVADTSILCEYLAVPKMSSISDKIREEVRSRHERGDMILVPFVALLETGNRQNGDGTARGKAAERYSRLVREVLDGTAPFASTDFPDAAEVTVWLDGRADGDPPSFVDWAGQSTPKGKGSGIVDLAIVHVGQRLHRRRVGRVRVWTLDEDLERRFGSCVGG